MVIHLFLVIIKWHNKAHCTTELLRIFIIFQTYNMGTNGSLILIWPTPSEQSRFLHDAADTGALRTTDTSMTVSWELGTIASMQ